VRTDYQDFLHQKLVANTSEGKKVEPATIHPILFPFQRDVLLWALRKGRAAIFLDTGLGKTFIQLEWARLLGETALIIAPLSVARQTIREGKKIGCDVRYVRSQSEVVTGRALYITNYEMINALDFSVFGAVVLDESSILKSLDGKTRAKLIAACKDIPYRLACTATPAPNDQTEIGNHADFLGICTRSEMLSMFFVHANIQRETVLSTGAILREKFGNDRGQEWRLKNHAREPFYRWLASWAMTMRRPSDLGYSDEGFVLPPLSIEPVWTDVEIQREGELFFLGLRGIGDRQAVRRQTISDRVGKLSALINGTGEQWIVWTGLQAEANAATEALPGAVQVQGADPLEEKVRRIEGFQEGEFRILVTKPRIAGFGLNLQNAHRMAFLGLNDSWESYYQCIRRQWRFGQKHPVDCHIILSTAEREVYENILRKEEGARQMREELLKAVTTHERLELAGEAMRGNGSVPSKTVKGRTWTAILGDACECLHDIAEDSIDLSVYSPPFADLYTYSPSDRDLGNSRGWDEFFQHYGFLIREVLRVTKPGRLSCVHTSDIPAMAVRDGYIGMRDFPGGVIRAHEECGWVFVGRAFVQKNPQAQAIRTKSKALLFVQLRKDSSHSRPAIVDQVLIFRKPGESSTPVRPVENGELDNERWIAWAHGIWTDIHESDVLRYSNARASDDEKHICPLQLGTIQRCITLYSNPGETVLTPFMGIGSEAYQAVRSNRRAIGIELKESYFNIAVQNLQAAEVEVESGSLFTTERNTLSLE